MRSNQIIFRNYFNGGEYWFDGHKIDNKRVNGYKRYRASDIGFIFQSYCLIDALSIEENIKMPYLYMPGQVMPNKIEIREVLEKLQLFKMREQPAGRLSGGETQRVAIARALIKKPKLIIADEPTGNLDESNSRMVAEAFRDIAKAGASVVVVTHNRNIDFGEGNKYILEQGRLCS